MIMSFGHKFGAPTKVDKTFDVRTLTHNVSSPEFLKQYEEIIRYGQDNRGATIAIGCEHGSHRSVVLANKAASALRTSVYHRDKSAKAR